MANNIASDPAYQALKEDLSNLTPERIEAFKKMMDEKIEQETVTYLTPKEFAERSGFAANTIRKWLREGVIKGKQVGKRSWRIPVGEIEKMKVE